MTRLSRRAVLASVLMAGALPAQAKALAQAVTGGQTGATGRTATAGQVPIAEQHLPVRIAMVLPGREGIQEAAFRQYLLHLGLQVTFDVYSTGDDPSRLPAILERLKADRPDLIYTTGTPTTLGIAGRFDAGSDSGFVEDIPIVFTTVAEPIAAGIVGPGDPPVRDNVTGSSHIPPLDRQVETILAYRPVSTIGTVYNPAELNSALTVKALGSLMADRGLDLIAVPVPLDADGLPQAEPVADMVRGLARDGAEFLYIGPDTFIAARLGPIVTAAALDAGLPSFSTEEVCFQTAPGALVGLVSRRADQGTAAGYKAEQILLHGAEPSQLPIDALAHFSLLVNVTVADALGIYPPMGLIQVAEFVRT
ncbi:ABC transporter substrate-binding protein [Marinibaculum pumilum]|uniref:ABC transporter substrate-binding protein n=1 Tax=Marinibaculum pumilum TaxID=1766165 RepID=A0ABV7L7U5_9PROT